jgi:hypothetical protein
MRRSILLTSPKIVIMGKKIEPCVFENFTSINNKSLGFDGAITYTGNSE